MIRVCITESGEYGCKAIRSYNNLGECVEQLLQEENFYNWSPSVIVSHPDDCTPVEGRDCDYQVEIYNSWRE